MAKRSLVGLCLMLALLQSLEVLSQDQDLADALDNDDPKTGEFSDQDRFDVAKDRYKPDCMSQPRGRRPGGERDQINHHGQNTAGSEFDLADVLNPNDDISGKDKDKGHGAGSDLDLTDAFNPNDDISGKDKDKGHGAGSDFDLADILNPNDDISGNDKDKGHGVPAGSDFDLADVLNPNDDISGKDKDKGHGDTTAVDSYSVSTHPPRDTTSLTLTL